MNSDKPSPYRDFQTSAASVPPPQRSVPTEQGATVDKTPAQDEGPRKIEPPPPPMPDEKGRMTVEDWASQKETEAWAFKAVKAGKQWPEGKLLTEKEYDDAIAWLKSKDCVCR